MSTPYSDILDRAMFRFADTQLARMNSADQSYILQKYLESAIADFQTKCQDDLTLRDEEGFEADLNNEVQEILALGVSYYWLSAKIMNSELLKNKLSTKDYSYFSPANLMREVQTLRDSVRKEYRDRVIRYTYDHGDVTLEGVE